MREREKDKEGEKERVGRERVTQRVKERERE